MRDMHRILVCEDIFDVLADGEIFDKSGNSFGGLLACDVNMASIPVSDYGVISSVPPDDTMCATYGRQRSGGRR